MKTIVKVALASVCAVSTFASCNKMEAPAVHDGGNDRVELNVTLGGAAVLVDTKTTGSAAEIKANEGKVNNLQVLVFRGDFLDAYGSASATSLNLSCTAGSRTVYAVVNAPSLASITSLSAFKSTLVDLSSNAVDSFVMVGSSDVTLPGTKSVLVTVSRMVSRIVLTKITRDFTSASLAGLSFTVDKIYLVNAAAKASYDFTAAPTVWYNEGENKTEVTELLVDAPGASIDEDGSYYTIHYFYTMPNPATSVKTKLVVEATLGTTKFYYPIELGALESNKSYEITSLTIKRPGSDDPDTPVSSNDISFGVSVSDWTTSSVGEKII